MTIIWATPVTFKITNHSKQSPNRRKFAQSGHPVASSRNGTTAVRSYNKLRKIKEAHSTKSDFIYF
jgi:hypothetical protein